jgi:uncharacterized membrane protein YhhN
MRYERSMNLKTPVCHFVVMTSLYTLFDLTLYFDRRVFVCLFVCSGSSATMFESFIVAFASIQSTPDKPRARNTTIFPTN